jgi:HEAT repeat protein
MKKTVSFGLFLLCSGLLSGFLSAQDISPDPPRELPVLPADIVERLNAEPPASETEEPPEDLPPVRETAALPENNAVREPSVAAASYKPVSQKTIEEQRRDTIYFGTDSEITSLIQTVKSENVDYLDSALIALVQNTMNRNILSGVFSFFADREKPGLEDRALRSLEDWDIEAADTVLGAVDYLGKLKVKAGIAALRSLLDTEDRRFMNAAFRSLGRIAGGIPHTAREIAAYLIDYYTNRGPGDDNRRDIIAAVGETGSSEGIDFLSEIAQNDDERVPLRIAALEALSKIGDAAGLGAVLAGVSSQDPNVRSAAVGALGPFEGPEVTAAILEAFRDSYYQTRMGAAKAAGTRKLTAAVPYLAYRAERDEVPQVKDEAIRALGAMDTGETRTILASFFEERKNSDRVRILAAEMLINTHAESYVEKLVTELDDAKTRNQTALYNGFLRVIGSTKAAKAPSLEDLTRRFLASGGVIEKSYALDMTANNEFRGLLEEVRALTDPKNGNLARKAQATLEKLDPSSRPGG